MKQLSFMLVEFEFVQCFLGVEVEHSLKCLSTDCDWSMPLRVAQIT